MTPTASGYDPHFVFETLRFHLRMTTLNVLPPYKGALLRGALDNAFRRLVCPLPRQDCGHCSVHDQCRYMALFHPSPPAGFPDAGKFGNAPPPYALKPSPDNRQAYHPQDILEFELTLIGRAVDAVPYFIFVVDRIGRRGLGPERGRYELRQVILLRDSRNQVIYDGADQTLRSLRTRGHAFGLRRMRRTPQHH